VLPPDALSKLALQTLLAPFVPVRTQFTVASPPQFADLFLPEGILDLNAARDAIGDLALLAREPALLEAYSGSISLEEARDCQRKQLTLHHQLELDASKLAGKPVRLPLLPLWLFSAGRPELLIDAWAMVPAAGWPGGFYRVPGQMRIGLVVVRKLRPGRNNLPLRLLGDGKVRQQALVDLETLPAGDPMREGLLGTLRTWRVVLPECQDDEERRALMVQVQKLVEAYENRLREEAHLAGLGEGKVEEARRAVLRVLTRRGLVVSLEQQAQVEACGDLATLERWLDQAITAANTDDALG
jgi:hypothetical protein